MKYLKKNITVILLTLSFVAVSNQLFAQHTSSQVRNLKIGDTIPDIIVRNLINSHDNQQAVSSMYKHGSLIINFWATWCVPCLREIPLLDSMQQEQQGKLAVLAVAYQDSAVVKKFLKAHPDLTVNHLPIATSDQLLSKYFRHFGLPHNVWIDNHGIVRAITGGEDITRENIKAFLAKKQLNLPEKKDNLSFDFTKTFHLGDSIFTYRSIFTPHIDGIPGGIDVSGNDNTTENYNQYFAFNAIIRDMFQFVYADHANYRRPDYRLIKIITKDSLRFYLPSEVHSAVLKNRYKKISDWAKDNTFCYELTLPKVVPDSVFYKDLIDELQRVFNVKYSIEKRDMLCNVVTVSSDSAKFHLSDLKDHDHKLPWIILRKHSLFIRNSTLKDLVHQILSTWDPKDDLWFDETGINYPITTTITFDQDKPITLDVVKAKLKEYGLVFGHGVRPYPIMVLTDLNN